MAPRRTHRSDEQHVAPSPPPSDPSTFAAAVCRIAVAQICVDAGFTAVQPSALRALEDVAGRHLAALGRSAASAAAARGRTDANIFDLVRAFEDLAAPRGFPGGADPTRPLLRSAPLRELMAFVEATDEVPFPKPIRRREIVGEGEQPGKEEEVAGRRTSFAEAGSEPPFRHVPRWLPCFPPTELWERKEVKEKKRRATSPEEEEEEPEMPAPVAANGGKRTSPVERIQFRLVKKGNKTRRLQHKGTI